MASEKLIWVGVVCCLVALAMQIFPNAAFGIGIDVNAAWLVFGFGVFLILIPAFLTMTLRGARNCNDQEPGRRR